MRAWNRSVTIQYAALGALFTCLATAQTPAPAGPTQPIPFSHKQHISNGLECKDCHTMPDPGDEATLPATAKCMACHVEIKKDSPAIQLLADYHKKGEEVPWKRVYHVPDYVFLATKFTS